MGNLTQYPAGNFCWVELGTNDQQAAKQFYGGLFGWQFNDIPMGEGMGDYTMLLLDDKEVGALYQLNAERQPGVPPHWMTYVAVENADEAAAKVESLGGTVLMPPFDVFTHGRMFALKDPVGATLSVWQAKEHHGMDVVGAPGAVCWNELATPDPDRASNFYSSLFGWSYKANNADGNYIEIHNDGRGIGGIMPMVGPQWNGVPPHWMPYFMVSDCDATAGKAWELGGKLCIPPQDIPNVGRFAVVTDPQGATFAVIQVKM